MRVPKQFVRSRQSGGVCVCARSPKQLLCALQAETRAGACRKASSGKELGAGELELCCKCGQ